VSEIEPLNSRLQVSCLMEMNVFTHVYLATHLQPTRQYQETTKPVSQPADSVQP
jgi:hypothetical protein